jgi:hypothetical protein
MKMRKNSIEAMVLSKVSHATARDRGGQKKEGRERALLTGA